MRPRPEVWWLNPTLLFVALCGGLALVTMLIPESSFVDNWSTPKFFDDAAVILTVACVSAFALGAGLPEARLRGWAGPRKDQPETELSLSTLLALYRTALALALFGYLVWGAIAIANGINWQVLVDVVTGQPGAAYAVRSRYLPNVAGITTCTQFGVAAAILGALVAAQAGWRKIWKSLGLLFGLAVFRAVLNTERLAILELAVPMIPVVVTQWLGPRAGRIRRLHRAIQWAPLAGIGVVFVIFALFEYGRSWTTFYAGTGESYLTFAAYRLLGYYVTAVNNGAYLLAHLADSAGIPFFTLNFLWRFPLLGGLMQSMFPNFTLADTYPEVLNAGANAEFNNGGGLFGPAIDFGGFGAVWFWLAAGLISGWVYLQFKSGSAWGLCLYPMLFLGTLEVPRGLYLCGGRAVPPVCFLILSAWLLRIQQRRQEVVALSGAGL